MSFMSSQCSLHTNKFRVFVVNREKKPIYSTFSLILLQNDHEIKVFNKYVSDEAPEEGNFNVSSHFTPSASLVNKFGNS